MFSKRLKYLCFIAIIFASKINNCLAADINPQIMGVPVKTILERIVDFILGIVGGITLLFLIISGIYYAVTIGDPDKQQKAKQMLIFTLEGFAIILLSYALIALVNRVLSA
jgi:hypothetical protein